MKRVLVPTDFSEHADRALTVAIEFAKPLGATIDLLHVYALPLPIVASIGGAVPPPLPLPTPDDLMSTQRNIDERAEKVRSAGLECSSAIVEGPAAAEIVSHSRKLGADLIVMATHGRTGIRRLIFGSVAQEVLRRTSLPLVLVPPIREEGVASSRS
jgi:nucleotide-binding universal stress UspA family protein